MPSQTPAVLFGAADAFSMLGFSRAHPRADTPISSPLCLTVNGRGDDAHAVVFQSQAENLMGCGPRELVIDVGGLDNASNMFVRVLSDVVTRARSRGCRTSVVGLDSAGILEALHRAPLSQLSTIYRSDPTHR